MAAREIEAGRAYVRVTLKGLDKASKKFRNWGMNMQRMGLRIGAAGVAMALPLASAVKAFADFDDAMRAVKGVTGALPKQFEAMRQKAKELGATTSFTATEVAALMVELGRAGFKPEAINEMTGSVLALSRATGTDAVASAGIMSASLRQFSLDASQAARVADVLTAGANKSFNTVESLGEALSYAGPVAKDFGLSLEDTVAMLGALGNVGIQGSSAGTALRRMMILSGSEADKLGNIFKTSFRDSGGELMGMLDILEEMNRATATMGREDRIKAFNEAFGLLGITGASALTGNIGSVKELRKALSQAGGTADETAKEMDAGLGGAFRILGSTIEAVKLEIGEALAPTIAKLSDKMASINQRITGFIKANSGAVLAVSGIVVGLIAAGTAFVSLGIALQVVSFAVAGIGAALALVASPIGIVTALVAGMTLAWMNFTLSGRQVTEALGKGFARAFDAIKDTLKGITNALKAGDIKLAGEIAMTGLKLAFFAGLQPIREQWIKWNKGLVEVFANAANGLVDIWGKTSKKLSKRFADLGYKLALMMSGEKDYLTDEERTGARDSAIDTYFDDMTNKAKANIDGLADAIQDNLNAEIAEGEERIKSLTSALESLGVEAEAAAEAARDWSGGHTGMAIAGAGAAAGGMGLAGMVAAAASATLAEHAPRGKPSAGSAGSLYGSQIGTFSAQAAGAMFGNRTEDAIVSTAENTKEMADHLKKNYRRRIADTFR